MATCRQYGFSERLAHALTRRDISRAKLGEIDQGIAVDDRPTARQRWPGCWLEMAIAAARQRRTVVRIPGIDPGANRRTERPYYQAETALQVLDLIEAPEGGSTWLKWWRRWASNPRPETLGNRHLHH